MTRRIGANYGNQTCQWTSHSTSVCLHHRRSSVAAVEHLGLPEYVNESFIMQRRRPGSDRPAVVQPDRLPAGSTRETKQEERTGN